MSTSVRIQSVCRLLLTVFLATIANLAIGSETLKHAFIGDQGTKNNSRAVLQMIADEGTDLLLVQGDFAYDDNAAGIWISNMNTILGPRFPVLITVGNHDRRQWPVYREWQKQRISDIDELQCEGSPGVKAHCQYRGVSVVQIAPGIRETDGISPDDDYNGYLDNVLSNVGNRWRFCSWHKLQRDMQVGGKSDATGWDVYQTCLKHGGIVATAHEHSYSRTHLMRDFQGHDVVHRGNHLAIRPGQSFAFVSGLGGYDIRDQELFNDWWGSVYTSTQDAEHGALFCTLNGADADCYFKDINGTVPDRFTLHNENPVTPGTTQHEVSRPPDSSPTTQSPIHESDGISAANHPAADTSPSLTPTTSDTNNDTPMSPVTSNPSKSTGAVSIFSWLLISSMTIFRRLVASKVHHIL